MSGRGNTCSGVLATSRVVFVSGEGNTCCGVLATISTGGSAGLEEPGNEETGVKCVVPAPSVRGGHYEVCPAVS